MTAGDRLLRWYPRAWRERYGDELVALIDDLYPDGRLGVGCRVSIMWEGLRERAHGAGLVGGTAAVRDRRRMGALVVLWAWTAFVVAGCALAKNSEQVASSDARDVVVVLAVVAGVAVAVGALAVSGAALSLLRRGGARHVSVHARRAMWATAISVLATCCVVTWAGSLPRSSRESAPWPYALAYCGWAAVVAATLACWTGVAFAVGRRVRLSDRLLSVEATIASVVAVAMVSTTVAAIIWRTGLPARGSLQTAVVIGAMVVADAVAGFGVSLVRPAR
jgi:hypothetical protein